MTSRRDVEQDIRDRLVREARIYLTLIDRRQTTEDGAAEGLVRTAFGSADRLRGAAAQLRSDDPDSTEALELLDTAVQLAEHPSAPKPRRPGPVPDIRASRRVPLTPAMVSRDGTWRVVPIRVERDGRVLDRFRVTHLGFYRGEVASVEDLAALGVPISELIEDDASKGGEP